MANYRPDTCADCRADTWCEQRANGKPQCRACKIIKFFDNVLYQPFGFKLLKWQAKVLRDIYGTVDNDGTRVFRRAYISVAKKQGKSWLCGGLPVYHLICETEGRSEVYSAASAKDQAAIVYRATLDLVKKNQFLLSRLKPIESTKRIMRRDGGGFYSVLSADGDVQDGIEPSLAIVDELHRWKTRKAETLLDVLVKGTISRTEPLVMEITTVGEEHESPLWFSEHQYARHVIDGSLEAKHFYAAIWAADPKRIETDPTYWKSRAARVAANPSHEDNGGFLKDARLVELLEEAIAKPEKYVDYLRYHLNVPIAKGESPVIDMALWCDDHSGVDLRTWPEYDVELLMRKWNLIGQPCIVGIDLSWTTDMTCVVCVFPPTADNEQWRVLPFFWLPSERVADIERRTRASLAMWERQKFLELMPGAEIDMNVVLNKVEWAAQMFDVREVAFDRWGGIKAAANLKLVPQGFVCVEIPQTFGGLTAATKTFLGLYMNHRLAHGNNPVLNWHASCLALETDGGDNVKPSKPKRDIAAKRIDGVAATITAIARAVTLLPQADSVIEVW